jgi:hypothetical protein
MTFVASRSSFASLGAEQAAHLYRAGGPTIAARGSQGAARCKGGPPREQPPKASGDFRDPTTGPLAHHGTHGPRSHPGEFHLVSESRASGPEQISRPSPWCARPSRRERESSRAGSHSPRASVGVGDVHGAAHTAYLIGRPCTLCPSRTCRTRSVVGATACRHALAWAAWPGSERRSSNRRAGARRSWAAARPTLVAAITSRFGSPMMTRPPGPRSRRSSRRSDPRTPRSRLDA